MKVRSAMTAHVQTVGPSNPVRQVARLMSEIDAGVMPVADDGRVIGLITDRDIVLRVVAEGLDADTAVADVMTTSVESCLESDDVEQVVERMADRQIRRMIVLDDDGRLAGVLSLGDVAGKLRPKAAGRALESISDAGDAPAR